MDESRRNFSSIVNMINASAVDELNPNAKSPLDCLFEALPKDSLAWKFYSSFKQATGKTLKSIIISCITRLQPFMTPQVSNLTRTDNMELEKIGEEKTALFIITPQADRTYSFLASMLYSQLFETLYYIGEQQKAAIGKILLLQPKLLLLDEPTKGIDAWSKRQLGMLLKQLKQQGITIIMVTHDLGVIASMCDEILVMYGGRVCERGTADDIFYRPAHEYTKGLLRSIPKADNMNEKLVPIGGTPINLLQMPAGCAFCPRCDAAMKICLSEKPEELRISDTHLASCWMNIKELYEAQEEAE